MSIRYWIDPENVKLLFFSHPKDFIGRKDDIELVCGDDLPDNYWDWAPGCFGDFTLVYCHNVPIGIVRVDCYKHSAHLHGQVRAGYEGFGYAHHTVKSILSYIFFILRKRTVFVTEPPGNLHVRGFVIRWGFQFSHKTAEGKVYRLEAADYAEKHCGIKVNVPQDAKS